jgi:hypothetical protein
VPTDAATDPDDAAIHVADSASPPCRDVDVDPNRLRTYNLPLRAVVAAVRDSNLNVGGNVLESNGAWLIVRGVGLIESVDDVKQIVVGASNGVPVYVEQVADVQVGNAFRVASLVKGTKEAVGGVVVARTGVNTKNGRQHKGSDRRREGGHCADCTWDFRKASRSRRTS